MMPALAILVATSAPTATPREPPCRTASAPLAYRAVSVRCRPTLPRQFIDRP